MVQVPNLSLSLDAPTSSLFMYSTKSQGILVKVFCNKNVCYDYGFVYIIDNGFVHCFKYLKYKRSKHCLYQVILLTNN